MKYLFFIFTAIFFSFFLLSTGCRSDKREHLLEEAEIWLKNEKPDSALQVLRQLPEHHGFTGSQQARYAVAFTRATFKTDYRENSDSLIFTAVDYYRSSPDSSAYAEALMLAAQTNYRLARWNRADSLLDRALKACPADRSDRLFDLYRWKMIVATHRENYDDALAAAKKEKIYADRLQNDQQIFFSINDLASVYKAAGMLDSALTAYRKAWNKYRADRMYGNLTNFLHEAIAGIYLEKKEYRAALEHARQAKEFRNNRWQLPVANLTIARIFMACHQTDSARHYLQKAIKNIDPNVSAQGFHYLMELDMAETDYKSAYYNFLNYKSSLEGLMVGESSQIERKMYQEEKLKNENARLKLYRQKQQIYIMLLCIFLLLTVLATYIVYSRNRKKSIQAERKREEERFTEKARRLENENLLLKQQQELSQLREKTAELRESLFRKLPVVHKIPSLDPDKETAVSRNPEGRIPLTDTDWFELLQAVDEIYGNFVSRLRQAFPELTRSDLGFCCLLKIRVTMQDLSDIYCISKAGITKKKTRLKNEKFRLQQEEQTLDEFILNF